MTPKKRDWRTLALIISVAMSVGALGLSYQAFSSPGLPAWIEIQEGPVAHGVDKFYRNAYFKGNVETAGDLTVAGNMNLSGPMTMTGDVILGDDITDNVFVFGQMRSWDGTDNYADVSDVGALDQTDGWQSSYNLTGWGTATSFRAFQASTRVTTTMPTTMTIYGAVGSATFISVTGAGNAAAIGLMGEATAQTTATIPIAYSVYASLGTVAAGDTISRGVNFMADLDSSGTITTSRILYTEADTWTYGVDLSQATIETADIVLSNGETIVNTTNGIITMTATTADVIANLNVSGTLDVQGGDITLQNDDSISNSSAGVITFTTTTVGVDAALAIVGTLTLSGSVSSDVGDVNINDGMDIAGMVEIADAAAISGDDDEVQLTITGWTTQTNDLMVIRDITTTSMFTVSNVGDIYVAGNADLRGNVDISGTLELEDVVVSGPIRFGSDANTTHGERIAHGLGTTPTAVILTPISATLTLTHVVVVSATNAVSFTVGITPPEASGYIGVYWMAGK